MTKKKETTKKRRIIILEKSGGKIGSLYFEQCETYNGNQFYLTHRKGKEYKNFPVLVAHEDEYQKLIYTPFPHEIYPFNLESVNLPPQAYGKVIDLFNEVRQYIYDHWDYYDKAFYDVLASWVLATYLPEKWRFIAYVAALGDKGTGKTRMLNCLTVLCYRGFLTVDPTEATLFRSITAWNPTLFIDESETVTKKQKEAVQSLLNAGQKRGSKILRTQQIKVGGITDYKIKFFKVFGFKGLAGTRMWLPTLRRRSLIAFTTKEIREVEREIDIERARKIRQKLLQYRIDYVDVEFSESQPKIKKLIKKLRGGIYELFFSLFSVTPSEKWNSLLKYAYKEERNREGERSMSEMAEVFYAIFKLKPRNSNKIRLNDISEYLNREKLIHELYTSRQIGTIASLLGFQKKHTKLGSVIIWNQEIVDRLKEQYGFTEEKGDEVTITPQEKTLPIFDTTNKKGD